MELDQVRAFLAVARSGSISKAARELYRTQPAISIKLQALETKRTAAVGCRFAVDRARRSDGDVGNRRALSVGHRDRKRRVGRSGGGWSSHGRRCRFRGLRLRSGYRRSTK